MAVVMTNPYHAHKGAAGSFYEEEVRAQRTAAHVDPVTKSAQMLPSFSNPSLPTIGLSSPTTHFEEQVSVTVRQYDREEVLQPLGVAVATGTIGTARCVTVRLTDPNDPFFLYSMTLSENDYGKFKDVHELHVDWNGFPQNLIAMFSGGMQARGEASAGVADRSISSHIPSGLPAVSLHFVAQSNGQGTLRVLERTGFRSLEHLSLTLMQQGDVGQKQYLAERYKFFEGEYYACARRYDEEVSRSAKTIAELRADVSRLEAEQSGLQQRLEKDMNFLRQKHDADIIRLKDSHATELRTILETSQAERKDAEARTEDANRTVHSKLASLQAELEATSRKLSDTEHSRRELAKELADTQTTLKAVRDERLRLESENEELRAFQTSAVKEKTQMELREATQSERLKHFESGFKERTADVAALRTQLDTYNQHADALKRDVEYERSKVKTLEAQLAQARAAINTRTQALATAQEREKALTQQLQTKDALLQEKILAAERAKQESTSFSERLEIANSNVTDLQAKLAASQKQCEELKASLKQSEDALVHTQRVSHGGLRFTSSQSALPGGAASYLASRPASASFMPTAASVGGAGAPSYFQQQQQPVVPSATPGLSAPLGARSTAGLMSDFARGASTTGAIVSAPLSSVSQTTSFASQQLAPQSSRAPVGVFADSSANTSMMTQENALMFGASSAVKPSAVAARPTPAAAPPTSVYFPSLAV